MNASKRATAHSRVVRCRVAIVPVTLSRCCIAAVLYLRCLVVVVGLQCVIAPLHRVRRLGQRLMHRVRIEDTHHQTTTAMEGCFVCSLFRVSSVGLQILN